jgi:hypothetical protein
MNEMNESIVKIAHDIASQNEIDWLFYFILFGIVGLGSFIGSFLNEYAKNRGQQLATKADLDEIHNQLKRSTEITEQVKSDIEHGIWRAKELEMLKREKLEEYLVNYYQTIENVHKKTQRTFFQNESQFDEACDVKLSMLQLLYLPELDVAHVEFLKANGEFLEWLAEGQKELSEKLKNGTKYPVLSSDHMEYYSIILRNFNTATLAIEKKAKEIARQLNTD